MVKRDKGKKEGMGLNGQCGSRWRENAKRSHPHWKTAGRSEAHIQEARVELSGLWFCWRTDRKTTPMFFSSCVCILHRTIQWKTATTSFFSPHCSFIDNRWVSLRRKNLSDPDIHRSSSFLSLNTHFVPTNTMIKNTVVKYCWFIQKTTNEVKRPVLAVVTQK